MWNFRSKYITVPGWTIIIFLTYKILQKTPSEKLHINQYKNPHNYKRLVDPGGQFCGGYQQQLPEAVSAVNILILVASAINHADRRYAIRSTWGSKESLSKYKAKVLYMIGVPKENKEKYQKEISEEFLEHGDILQEDFLDSYSNLTLKTIGAIKWASENCGSARYVMKTDDDIYLNIAKLNTFLKGRGNEKRTIYGCIKNSIQGSLQPIPSYNNDNLPPLLPGGGIPQPPEGLPYSPGRAFPTPHPPFTAGAGYVITRDLIPELSIISQNISIIRVEDAFMTGHCARRAGHVNKVHDNIFSCGQLVQRDCDMKNLITGHKITPERMKTIYDNIHKC